VSFRTWYRLTPLQLVKRATVAEHGGAVASLRKFNSVDFGESIEASSRHAPSFVLNDGVVTARFTLGGAPPSSPHYLPQDRREYDSRGRHAYAVSPGIWIKRLKGLGWGDNAVAQARRLLRQIAMLKSVCVVNCVLPIRKDRHLSAVIALVVPHAEGWREVLFHVLPDESCVTRQPGSLTSSPVLYRNVEDTRSDATVLERHRVWRDGYCRWEWVAGDWRVANDTHKPSLKRRVLVQTRSSDPQAPGFGIELTYDHEVSGGTHSRAWWTTADEAAAWASLELMAAGLPCA
jgi:hypothetical protein